MKNNIVDISILSDRDQISRAFNGDAQRLFDFQNDQQKMFLKSEREKLSSPCPQHFDLTEAEGNTSLAARHAASKTFACAIRLFSELRAND